MVVGVGLAVRASEAQSKAIASVGIGRDITGEIVDQGWWSRQSHLWRGTRQFRAGVVLTLVGVFLQTIGGVLAIR